MAYHHRVTLGPAILEYQLGGILRIAQWQGDVVYLLLVVLAAQYESWTSPVAAVMGLPVALLGAMLPTKVRSKYEMQLNILQKKTFSSSALSQP